MVTPEVMPCMALLLTAILVCVIRHKVSRDVLAETPGLRTTKADKSAHGFGTKIVSQAVKRCDGILNHSMEDGFFTVKVTLPLTHTGTADSIKRPCTSSRCRAFLP